MDIVPRTASFPDHLIPEEQKDQAWHVAFCRAAYDHYQRLGDGKTFYQGRHHYEKIDRYSQARQSEDIYKALFEPEDQNSAIYTRVDYTPLAILPKLLDTAEARLNKSDYYVSISAIDPLSEDELLDAMNRLETKISLREELEKMEPGITEGTALAPIPGEPESVEELEMQKEFLAKHNAAVDMETAIDAVLNHNRFSEQRAKTRKWLLRYGVGGYKTYIDNNGSVQVRAIDPRRVVVSYCEERDFSDAFFIGEVRSMRLQDVRQRAGKQFTLEEYQNMASRAQLNGPMQGSYYGSDWDDLKDLRVQVLDIEFYSISGIAFEEKIDPYGNLRVSQMVDLPKAGAKQNARVSYKTVHRAMWVVDTDYCFDFGLVTNMKRDKNRLADARLNYVLFAPRRQGMSIVGKVEECIPMVDQAMYSWMKIQQIQAEARPKGVSIEIGALEQAASGNTMGMSEQDILDLFYQKGIVLWRLIDEGGLQTSYKPIEELPGGVGAELTNQLQVFIQYVQLIKDILGINDLTDGSTPDPRTLTTTAQLAAEGSNNAIYHVVEADRHLFQSVCEDVLTSLHDVAEAGGFEAYRYAVGEHTMRFFRDARDITARDYGMRIEDKPTDEERQFLLAQAAQRADADMLTMEDFLTIKNTDNLKLAEQILAHRLRKRKREQRAEQQQMMEAQVQAEGQKVQMQEQSRQATLQLEHQLQMHRLALEHANEKELVKLRKAIDAKLALTQAALGKTNHAAGLESKEYIAELNAARQRTDSANRSNYRQSEAQVEAQT